MNIKISLFFMLVFSVVCYAQKNSKNDSQKQNIESHFRNKYDSKNYKKFDGKLTIKDNSVLFDSKIIYYDKNDKNTLAILKNGIIYPQLLTEFQMNKFIDETTDRTQKRFLKLQKDPKASFDINNVKLSNLVELNYLNSNEKFKRFKITLKDFRLNTTTYYVFELKNNNAKTNTSLEEFINGGKLTYINTL